MQCFIVNVAQLIDLYEYAWGDLYIVGMTSMVYTIIIIIIINFDAFSLPSLSIAIEGGWSILM